MDDEQQIGEQGYCCAMGEYWKDPDGPEGPLPAGCDATTVCNPTPCNYDISIDPYNYFNSGNCIRDVGDYWEACCDKYQYGQQNYYYCEVEAI